MKIGTTKMSSRGQIVIPLEMRSGIKEGDKLIIIKDDERLIIKKAESLTKNMKEDLEFAKRTEDALKRIEAGDFISIDSENLSEEMDKW